MPPCWPRKSKIFRFLGVPRGVQNFMLFWHRFFIDLGSVLASNMGPSWEPRRLKIRKNGPKILRGTTPRAALNTNLLLKGVQEPLGLDFGGGQGSIFDDFWIFLAYFGHVFGCSFWSWFSLFLVRSSTNFCQENPRTCRAQSRESKNLPRTKPRTKSVRTPPRMLNSQSFVLLSSIPYRNPPCSKNLGRRYSPQGGFKLNSSVSLFSLLSSLFLLASCLHFSFNSELLRGGASSSAAAAAPRLSSTFGGSGAHGALG